MNCPRCQGLLISGRITDDPDLLTCINCANIVGGIQALSTKELIKRLSDKMGKVNKKGEIL